MRPEFKKRNPNTPARRARRKAAEAAAVAVTKSLAPKQYKASGKLQSAIKAVLSSATETKYVAEDILTRFAVLGNVSSPVQFQRLLPRMSQGIADFQRIGDQVKSVRARTIHTLYLADTSNTFDVIAHLWIVGVKGATTSAAVSQVPASQFLKVGNGTNCDPTGFTPDAMLSFVNNYPLNTEQYTRLKHFVVRFSKGAGQQNAGAAAYSGQMLNTKGAQTCAYSWSPPTLKYNESPDTLPTNHYPVAFCWATASDGTALQGNILQWSVRTEMYFKDS